MKYLGQKLNQNGYKAKELNEIPESPAVFIVSPGKKPDQLAELVKELPPGSVLVGGQTGEELTAQAQKRGVRYVNIMEDEAFSVQNAVPTAEGALALILSNTEYVLRGTDAAITGFGRIGKILSQMLHHMGAAVHVIARNPVDRAWAMGFHVCELAAMRDELRGCRILVNTVPAQIIGINELQAMQPNSLLIELASFPYGFDARLAEEMGHRVIMAQALPAKTAPESAAEYMAEAVMRIARKGF